MNCKIGINQVDEIAIGATLLGTGGGGDPYIGKLMAKMAIEQYGEINLINIEDVPNDALVVPVAFFGAPLVISEKLANGNEAITVFEALEKYLGKKIYATMPIEAGGINSMAPLALAAQKKIPVVDADGMGRAFPSLQMVIPTLHGIAAGPIAQVDEKGNTNIYNPISNKWGEVFLGSTVLPMGGSCVIACYPMTGKQLRKAVIPNVVSYCLEIGKKLTEAKNGDGDMVQAVLEAAKAKLLFQGKITDVSRTMNGRHQLGTITVEGLKDFQNKEMFVDFQNEFLIAKTKDTIFATTPDLISVIDTETGMAITTEALRYGQRVTVLAMPCNKQWKTKEGLELAGPKVFGYDVPFVAI
jgi:hypothetical protein